MQNDNWGREISCIFSVSCSQILCLRLQGRAVPNFWPRGNVMEWGRIQSWQKDALESPNACTDFWQGWFVLGHLTLLTERKSCLAAHSSLPLPCVCIHSAPLWAACLIGHIVLTHCLFKPLKMSLFLRYHRALSQGCQWQLYVKCCQCALCFFSPLLTNTIGLIGTCYSAVCSFFGSSHLLPALRDLCYLPAVLHMLGSSCPFECPWCSAGPCLRLLACTAVPCLPLNNPISHGGCSHSVLHCFVPTGSLLVPSLPGRHWGPGMCPTEL